MSKKKTTQSAISTEELIAVRELMVRSKLDLVDSVRLAMELHESAGKNLSVRSLREAIRLGVEAMKRTRSSVTMAKLYEIFCAERSDLRSRTLSDYRYIWRKLQERFPNFLRRRARAVTSDDMREILLTGFRTPRQRCKARSILHSLFTYAERRRWISSNPVTPILIPKVREQEIVPLSLKEIRRLLDCVRTWESGSCAPAAGLMLFAGIRPREVERLHWRDIDFEENVICIRPINSKTGGTRHVTICVPLRALLLESVRTNRKRALPDAPIVPPNWETRWLLVRRSAGWNATTNIWRQDVLRHTFASYHAKFYRDYQLLQSEMGHANANLLRTRYISMLGITRTAAENFWTLDVLRSETRHPLKTPKKFMPPLPASLPKPLPKKRNAPFFSFRLLPPTLMLPCAETNTLPQKQQQFTLALRPPPLMLPCAETDFFRTAELLRCDEKSGFIDTPWQVFGSFPTPFPSRLQKTPIDPTIAFRPIPPLVLPPRGTANFRCENVSGTLQ